MPIGDVLPRPSRLYSGPPRERGRPARILIFANRSRSSATPLQGAPNLPLLGSSLLGHVLCGRDARAPGGRPARILIFANRSRSSATPLQGAPNLPLLGSSLLGQVRCGRDARAPGGRPARILIAANRLRSGATPLLGAPNLPLLGSSLLGHVRCGRDARAPGGRPARILIFANRSRSSATPLQGAPNLPLLGSSLLGQVLCGRDARAPGWASRTHPYCCQQVAIRRHSLAGCAEPALAGFVASGPRPMRARRPRSRVGVPHASLLLPTGRDPAPLSCRVRRTCPCWVRRFWATSYAGETPALPGGVPPASLFLRTGRDPALLLCKGRRTCPCWVHHFWARSYAGETPALPGGRPARILIAANRLRSGATPLQGAPNPPLLGSSLLGQVLCGRDARAPGGASRPHPYCCQQVAIRRYSLAGCAEPALAGFVASGPRPMRARRPRSRGEQLFFCRASSSMPLPTRSLGEDGGVAAAIVGPVAGALVEGFRELKQGSEECPELEADTGPGQETGLGERQTEAVLQDPSGVGDALPDEQILILANGVVNEVVAELPAVGARCLWTTRLSVASRLFQPRFQAW